MDPNTALESILRGHMVQEHVEALRDWLQGGGFPPALASVPVDCHVVFSEWPKYPWLIQADSWGISVHKRFSDLRMSWAELAKLQDSEY